MYNSLNVKEEPTIDSSNQTFAPENQTTIPPMTVPIKKEKPTAK